MNLPRVFQAERKVLVLAVLAGLFVGFVDAVLDYLLFYEGTFLELLVTNVPEHEIYTRSVILAAFVVFGLITSRSVARRRRTEDALRESERAKATLLSNLPGMACRCLDDRDWTTLFVSEGAKKLTGYDPSELIDNKEISYGEIVHRDDRDAVWSEVQEALASNRPFELAYRIVTKEGEEKWVWEQGRRVAQTENGTGILEGFITDITQRRLAEQALRESEERFRLLVENQSDMVVKFDNDGRLLFLSPSYCRAFGKSEQELAGSTFMPLIHEDDREAVARAIESVQQPPHNSYVEERALTVEGWRWQAWVNTAVLNEQNEVVGIVASGRDITDRKRAEDALRGSERNLAEAQRMAHLGSWKWNIGTGQVEWSREVYRIFGLDPNEFRPDIDSVMSHFHPEDRDKHETLIEQAVAHREQYDFEARIQLPDGSVRDVISTSQGHYDSQGNLTQLSGTVQDITERKRAEESLRVRVRQLAALNSLSSRVSSRLETDQIVQVALEGIVEQIGTDLAILFLRTDGELGMAGVRPDLSRFGGETMPVHRVGECLCGLAVSTRDPVYSRNIADDPRCTWEECKRAGYRSFAALPLVSGEEIFGVLGLASETIRDYGEEAAFLETLANEIAAGLHNARLYEELRRQTNELTDANEQVRRLNVELEGRVEQRTAELRAANEELEAFAYSVSHDLRAPLRAMEGLARALVEDCADSLNADGQEFCQHIVDSAIDMDGLIKDLLAYSRIGRTELHLQAVGLEGVVAEAIEQLQPSITSSNAEIVVDGQLPSVRAHPATLRQVVANLLSNGVKFAHPDQRPRIRIWAEPRADMVRLWVEDNGIGIDEEYQTRVFQVFERLHGVERYPGTGIGLAIVQRATERMGGRCGVESTVGQGSRFWVEYPRQGGEHELDSAS